MKPYSMDLRVRVLADCDSGLGTNGVAEKYSVSPAWVRRLKQRRRERGEIGPRCGKPGPKPRLTAEHHQILIKLVEQQPDATLAELRDQLGVDVGINTIWRTLKTIGITLKKSSPCR